MSQLVLECLQKVTAQRDAARCRAMPHGAARRDACFVLGSRWYVRAVYVKVYYLLSCIDVITIIIMSSSEQARAPS